MTCQNRKIWFTKRSSSTVCHFHHMVKLILYKKYGIIMTQNSYPLIGGPFYPQNGKNGVSTKLCDELQPMNYV